MAGASRMKLRTRLAAERAKAAIEAVARFCRRPSEGASKLEDCAGTQNTDALDNFS
jgi:hypothetical protein